MDPACWYELAGNKEVVTYNAHFSAFYLYYLYLIFKSALHQVLHRLQNKEKPMQNNFDSPVRVTQNDFRVQHCKV